MGITTGYSHAFDITPSDTVNLGHPCEAIYVGGAGNVTVLTAFGETVVFTAPPLGAVIPIKAKRVMAAGTTATLLKGFWGGVMSKTDVLENDLLKLLFNATPIANLADNAASAPITNIYVSLHTADPGEAGVQTTNETSYGGYARVAKLRTSGGWTVTASSVSPQSNIDFPEATSGTGTLTHFGVGTLVSGAGKLLYKGAISPTITIATGVAPRLTTASTITED